MKKFLKIAALIFGGLILFLALAVLLLPYFVNLEAIKHRLSAELSRKLRAQVELKEVDLRLLPRPGLKVRGLSLVGKDYRFRLKAGVLVLELRPLLSRRIQVDKFSLTGPELEFYLPNKKESASAKKKKKLYQELKIRLAKLPPFSLEIEEGELRCFRGEKLLFGFSQLEGSLALKRPPFLQWELKGRGSMAEKVRFSGSFWPEERLSEGLLAVTHLDLERLPFLQKRFPKVSFKSDLNLEVSYRWEEGTFLFGFTATAPCLLKGKGKDYLFHCSAILGQARLKPPYFRVELKEWVMKEPFIKARGVVLRDQKGFVVSFDVLEGQWKGVRKRLLAFLGEKKGVKRLGQIIEAGRVKDFHLETKAPYARRLFHLETLSLRGQVEGARLNLPQPQITLTQVSGRFDFEKGLLEVEKAQGRFRKTVLDQASFKINLRQIKDRISPLVLKGKVKGLAEDVLLVLQKTPLPLAVKEKLARTQGKGPLQGQLDLEGTLKKLKVSFEILPQGVSLRYQDFPLPFRLDGGRIRCENRLLSLRGLKVVFPQSVLRTLTAKIDFRKHPPYLTLTEARGLLAVSETMNFLLSFKEVAAHLQGYAFRGDRVELLSASYEGPLKAQGLLARLGFRLKGENLEVLLPQLPGPLFVERGIVSYRNFSLFVEPSQGRLLDAEGLVNGQIDFRPLALRLEGEASSGENFLRWIYEQGHLPLDFFPKTPVKAESFVFVYKPPSLSFEGDLFCREAPLRLRLQHQKGSFSLETELKEPWFALSFKRTPKSIDFSLSGRLDDQAVRQYLRTNPFLIQEIEGELKGHYVPQDILKSSFTGNIRLSRFRLPSKRYPFWIEELDVKAQGKVLFFRRLEMDLNGTSFEASGRLELSPNLLNLDGSVYMPVLVVEDVLSVLKEKKGPKTGKHGKKTKLVLHLSLSADSVLYHRYEWSPFEGEIFYHPGDFKLVVQETYLCGIKLWGRYESAARQELRLSFDQPQGELKDTLQCFFGSDLIEGPFQLKGYLRTQGQRLFEETTGRYLFLSKEGHIYKFGTLAKIFALLSPLDIFQGNLPDFEKKGTDYNFWEVKGGFKKHYLVIDSWRLDAPGFRAFASGKIDLLKQKLDVTVLVSPFKAIDSLVGHVPLIGWILTGKSKTFLAVPLKVRGKINDPTVIPLDPTAVGAGVFGIIKRTFQLPVKIFVPDKEKPLTLPPPEEK